MPEVFSNLQALGPKGLETLQKNQFGETSLRADWDSEKIIIGNFKVNEQSIRFISEEHGTFDIGKNPGFLAVLDGLDGSNVYVKTQGKGRVGTMLGIYSGINPRFGDFVFGGIMEFPTGRLYLADFKRRTIEDNLQSGMDRQIRTSGIKSLKDAKIFLDEGVSQNLDFYKRIKQEFKTYYFGSSAIYYADLAAGRADVVLECTRKNNLEIAAAYPIIKQAGGVMIGPDGKDIGEKYYLEFGQNEHIPVITAANPQLASEVLSLIS